MFHKAQHIQSQALSAQAEKQYRKTSPFTTQFLRQPLGVTLKM